MSKTVDTEANPNYSVGSAIHSFMIQKKREDKLTFVWPPQISRKNWFAKSNVSLCSLLRKPWAKTMVLFSESTPTYKHSLKSYLSKMQCTWVGRHRLHGNDLPIRRKGILYYRTKSSHVQTTSSHQWEGRRQLKTSTPSSPIRETRFVLDDNTAIGSCQQNLFA